MAVLNGFLEIGFILANSETKSFITKLTETKTKMLAGYLAKFHLAQYPATFFEPKRSSEL